MDTGTSEKVSFSHHKVHTEIVIDAPPEVVWSVLTNTANYGNWAAFLVGIKGEIKEGSKITVDFKLDPSKEKLTTLDHTITVVDGTEFYWAEKGPGGIRDNHHFRVEPLEGNKTLFVQSDEIMGGITFLMGGRLAKMYVNGYRAFNRGLKAEAERRAQSA